MYINTLQIIRTIAKKKTHTRKSATLSTEATQQNSKTSSQAFNSTIRKIRIFVYWLFVVENIPGMMHWLF